jgi:hypothetical protein
MAKAALFSMRLSDVTDRLVTEEAKRTRRTKGAVVEALASLGDRDRARRVGDRGRLALV